jgi:hypothetical protein
MVCKAASKIVCHDERSRSISIASSKPFKGAVEMLRLRCAQHDKQIADNEQH